MANLDERPRASDAPRLSDAPPPSDAPRPSMVRRLRRWRIGCGAGFGCMALVVAFFLLVWWLVQPGGLMHPAR
ncbi:MAG TPA: hypothetical protein VGY54_05190 [Polyangiaceae bacterium]|nr:hypothetical protein [Polyangiaceae bacterium]